MADGSTGGGAEKRPEPARSKVALLRLAADLRRIRDEAPPGISAAPVSEDNMFIWTASIVGPDETPWEGGVFSLRLTFPKEYPEKPPHVKFTCPIFHPNIYADGSLCLDLLQDLWSPVISVDMLLTSIASLLPDPNCASPANPEAARLMETDPKKYKRTVRRFAQRTVEE